MLRMLAVLLLSVMPAMSVPAAVKIKDLGRFDGMRDNAILGYGLVVGLTGTGDSPRNFATQQSVSNMLREFGLNVPPGGLNSRNVAAVLVTAKLPPIVRSGDKLDVNVAAIGDARSLAGGTLLLTPLVGADRELYATAQGPLAVGAFRFEQSGTLEQKNHPTAGTIPEGGIVERSMAPVLLSGEGTLDLVLHDPDFTTAQRVAATINERLPHADASAIEAGRVRLAAAPRDPAALVALVSAVEMLSVEPDSRARVIVNERTGTIVSGGSIWLSAVTITHGDIRVSIQQRFHVSQPDGFLVEPSRGIRTAVVPEARVDVREQEVQAVSLPQGATIADLVDALRAIRVSSRDVIAILQGIKRAGALHAELIIQ